MKNSSKSACPLCGCSEQQYIFSERDHNLIQCESCDLFFIDPYPEQDAVYETVSDYEYDDLEILDCSQHYDASIRYHDFLYPMLRPEFTDAKSVLDVGCGTGRLLEMLGEFTAMRRVGIELNQGRARFTREKANCEVLEVPVEKMEAGEPFDVIALMNIMSHVPNVVGFIDSLKPLLSGQGRVVIKIGEMDSSVKKGAVYDWQIPDHLQFFGLRTIETIANKTGFEVVRHERMPLKQEMFSKWRWMAPGRNATRNVIKKAIAHIPFALPLLRKIYEIKHGDAVYSSLIVLKKRISG